MAKVGVVIQARMSSRRLPGKSMMYISEHKVIEWVIHSCIAIKIPTVTILAIPDTQDSDCLEAIAKKYEIGLARGSENNVLSRYIDALEMYDLDYVVRVTGDDPCHCPRLLEAGIQRTVQEDADYMMSTSPGREITDGLIYEVISQRVMYKIRRDFGEEQLTQEHVTTPIRDGRIKDITRACLDVSEIPSSYYCSGARLCVDTLADLRQLRSHWNSRIDEQSGQRVANAEIILDNLRKSAIKG